MRQRKLKDLEQQLIKYQDYFAKDPEKYKGRWRYGNKGENRGEKVFVEIGSGKGAFITAQGKQHPQYQYVAIEGQLNVLVRVAEKIEENQMENIALVGKYIDGLEDLFEENEINGIYLNFSDPWPKKRHAKRRLTHRNYLASYRKVVMPGGFIALKTDSESLFSFSVEEAKSQGFKINHQTQDLHAGSLKAKEVMTEYEEKFSRQGLPIFYLELEVE